MNEIHADIHGTGAREARRVEPRPGSPCEFWLYTTRLVINGAASAYTYGVRTNITASPIKVPPDEGFTLVERTLHLSYPVDREREIENAREGRAGEPMRTDCTAIPGGRCWFVCPSTVLGPEWRFIETLAAEPGSLIGRVRYGGHAGCVAVPKGYGVVEAIFARTEGFWAFLEAEHRELLAHYPRVDTYAACPHCSGCGAMPVVAAPPGEE